MFTLKGSIGVQYSMKPNKGMMQFFGKKMYDARPLFRQACVSSCDNWLDPNNVEDINTKRSFMWNIIHNGVLLINKKMHGLIDKMMLKATKRCYIKI